MTEFSAQLNRMAEEIAENVRTHSDIRSLLDEAKALAEKEQLHERLAECFLTEMHLVTRDDDKMARRQFLEKAIIALKNALEEAGVPQRRGHLMGELSALYREVGDHAEAALWLQRAGKVFEETGDVFGLANFHGSMAEMYRDRGSLDEGVASYRRVLKLIEGRSFHQLAAGTRISLANALRFRRDFAEAQALLAEAEAICERHRMKDYISEIARSRSDIETELSAGQAASHTLPELLHSLDQLLRYKHENPVGYVAFWYFAWKTELMALLRSGPGISLMVVTDDVERFMGFAAEFRNLADLFLMATTEQPTVAAEKGVLAIPPSWLSPASSNVVLVKEISEGTGESAEAQQTEADDGLPNMVLSGLARMRGGYIPVSVQSDTEGERHLSALATPRMPTAAIELMSQRCINELIRRRALWFPFPRFDSKDAFLTDLCVAHERGVFPVYFDRVPTSDGATEIGAVRVHIPASALTPSGQSLVDKWKRALLEITLLQRDAAQAALLDLPEAFLTDGSTAMASELEVHLFEFTEVGRRVIRPVLLAR